MNYNFDWTNFDEKQFDECNKEIGSYEDKIYGFLYLTINSSFVGLNDKSFVIDIHYEYYNSKVHGFDLEIYEENDDGTHGQWIDCIKTIKSSKSYKNFCKRAENKILDLLRIHACIV
jgi:hypothetical protein